MTFNDCSGSESALVRTGLVLACVAVTGQTALYLVHVYVLDRSFWIMELDEGPLVTWATSVTTFSAGLLALLVGFLVPSERMRGPVIAVGAAFMSFDDAASVHERISYRIADTLEISRTYIQIIWPVLYFPLLATVAILLFQITRHNRCARSLYLTGLGALAAAVVFEVAGLALGDMSLSAWPWTLETVLEEGAETGGWIVIATAVAVRLMTAMRDPGAPGVTPLYEAVEAPEAARSGKRMA